MKIKTTCLNPFAMAVAIFSFCLTSAIVQSAKISGELVVELQGQDEPNYEHYFAHSELAPTIAFTDNFFIDGVLVLESRDSLNTFGLMARYVSSF